MLVPGVPEHGQAGTFAPSPVLVEGGKAALFVKWLFTTIRSKNILKYTPAIKISSNLVTLSYSSYFTSGSSEFKTF